MQYPPGSDSSDLPAPPTTYVTGDESSHLGLPAVFDRGPGFESLTAAAERGAALGYPFLSVVNDVAGMALSPVSVQVHWNHSYDRAKVVVQFADPDDVDAVAEFYEIDDVVSAGSIYSVQGLVDERHHGGPGSFDLEVFSGRHGVRP